MTMTADLTTETPPENADGPIAQSMELVWLSPAMLAEHPRNVRDEYGDLTELAASIAAQGVLEPLVIVPDEEGFQLVAGHRRLAAAIEARVEKVPCILRPDLAAAEDDNAGQAAHVAAMLSENLHRRGLTAVEEARGVQQMLDLGMDLERVAKATGLDRKQVALSAGVARLEADVAAAVSEANLTLEQAAGVALFADDVDVAEHLIESALESPGRFAHALTRAKQDREENEKLAARKAELEGEGREVWVDGDLPDHMKSLNNLHDAEGKQLTGETHGTCPGRGVYLVYRSWNGLQEFEACSDPGAYGHKSAYSHSPLPNASESKTEEEKAAASAERKKVIDNNKAMDAANTTRREWLRAFLGRKTTPKEVLRFSVETLSTSSQTVSRWLGGQSETPQGVKDGLGLQAPNLWSRAGKEPTLTSGEKVTDGRLGMQLFGHVAGAHESGIDRTTWRNADPTVVRWLTFLAGQGYELSDVEQGMVDEAARKAAEKGKKAKPETKKVVEITDEGKVAVREVPADDDVAAEQAELEALAEQLDAQEEADPGSTDDDLDEDAVEGGDLLAELNDRVATYKRMVGEDPKPGDSERIDQLRAELGIDGE